MSPAGNNANLQLVEIEQMRASLKIQKKGGAKSKRSSQRSLTKRSSLPDTEMDKFIISEDGTKLVGQEAQITQKALQDYKRKKHRLMKNRRVFGDNKIATIDEDTYKST